jgi:hypothetical protein
MVEDQQAITCEEDGESEGESAGTTVRQVIDHSDREPDRDCGGGAEKKESRDGIGDAVAESQHKRAASQEQGPDEGRSESALENSRQKDGVGEFRETGNVETEGVREGPGMILFEWFRGSHLDDKETEQVSCKEERRKDDFEPESPGRARMIENEAERKQHEKGRQEVRRSHSRTSITKSKAQSQDDRENSVEEESGRNAPKKVEEEKSDEIIVFVEVEDRIPLGA